MNGLKLTMRGRGREFGTLPFALKRVDDTQRERPRFVKIRKKALAKDREREREGRRVSEKIRTFVAICT